MVRAALQTNPAVNGATSNQVSDVRLADLFVDTEHYQRPPILGHVDHLKAHWDPRIAMVLAVSIRADGTLALVDGQHRALAAQQLGYTTWQASIWEGLSIPEEAQLFLWLNQNRRAHTPLGRWKAELTAGNPTVHAIQAIVTELGYELVTMSKHVNPRALSCPETLLTIAGALNGRPGDPERVRQVLTLTNEVWPDEPMGMGDRFLAGLALFFRRYGAAIEYDFMVRKFKTVPVATLMRQASSISDNEAIKKSAAYAIAFQRAYDRGRRQNRLEPPRFGDGDE